MNRKLAGAYGAAVLLKMIPSLCADIDEKRWKRAKRKRRRR